ncbi:Glutathione reductase [Azospirillaceae bacterium]
MRFPPFLAVYAKAVPDEDANMSYDFDLITIGAGSGGVAASRRAASYGAKVAIFEGDRVGGTCVIRGCVPKKLLMYAGQYRDGFEDALGYGWSLPSSPTFDWKNLIAAKGREIDRLNRTYHNMLEKAGVTLIPSFARLIDPHTVEANGRRHTAHTLLIATGGHPVRPDVSGGDLAITSNEALELSTLPNRIIIIGAGYIAVEFAAIFNALGADVTLMVRGDGLLRGFDADVRSALSVAMQTRGVKILTGAQPAAIEQASNAFLVTTKDGAQYAADLVMAATGRAPNTSGLGLETVGVATHPRTGAVQVDLNSRTNIDSIYAVGDVTNRVSLTPVAIAEGRALAETLYNNNPMQVSYDNIPTAVFTSPPIGTVGLTEEQARAHNKTIDIYRTAFRPMKNTLSGRDERTMMKLVVDSTDDRVLGAHMVGPDAPEIIQGVAIALNCGATKKQFDRTIGLHPSAAEEFVTMRDKVS